MTGHPRSSRPDERRLTGTVVDSRYEIRDVLGVGGMSTVYLAYDQRLERLVAVKVISPNLGADDSFLRRFTSEARASARLSHPNVVHVLDRSSEQSMPYIVFEYVPGRTLRQLIQDEAPLPNRRALTLWRQLIAALAHAHEAGIIHRDVKPDNVLVAEGDVAKLTDFGLARAVAESKTTATIMGTARYVAPEVITDSDSDARSDLYSAGILLFELLVGTPPFTGANPINVAYAHVHRDVPAPSTRQPGIHPELDDLVTWCCSREPDNRPQTARDLLTEIDHILTLVPADPPRQTPPRPPGRRPTTAPAGGESPTTVIASEQRTTALRDPENQTRALGLSASDAQATEDLSAADLSAADLSAAELSAAARAGSHRLPPRPPRPTKPVSFGPLELDDAEPTQALSLPAAAAAPVSAVSASATPASGSPVTTPVVEPALPSAARPSRRERKASRASARQPLRSVRRAGSSSLTAVVVLILAIGAVVFGVAAYMTAGGLLPLPVGAEVGWPPAAVVQNAGLESAGVSAPWR